ncbi:PhzF family phenazine biosynthesis protein [bacterium]|nr:PhzF family phenazine biosynthesis protein [bacterium]
MKLKLYQVDAFTEHLFGGNPAAVIPLETWLPDRAMQAIAMENNLSETAFLVLEGEKWHVRWFTPSVEVDLCGHATLASAFTLFHTGLAKGNEIVFDSKSGELRVERDGDLLRMDFPARPALPQLESAEIIEALGVKPRGFYAARDLLVLFDSEEEVRKLKPDFVKMASLDFFAVVATAPGDEVDFVSRFFAPVQGIDEDPVTGSAHSTLIPFWAERLGKQKLKARQISSRGGELDCEHRGERVSIAGKAVLYLTGEIDLASL